MAGCKKAKRCGNPAENQVRQGEAFESFYHLSPSWVLNWSDTEMWSISRENAADALWDEIIPYMKSVENKTWQELLVYEKKKNHGIDVRMLNKAAQDRLADLHIEAEAIYSLRLTGNHRLYGLIDNGRFKILWYDTDHGDNDTCVCRSHMKHT